MYQTAFSRREVALRRPDLRAIRITEVGEPTVGEDEVLVRVHAATVNRTDCGFRAAKPWIVRFFSGLFKPKATVLGSEFAGEVEAVGQTVTSFEVGDRVFGFSEFRFGAHAEHMAIPAAGPIATVPPTVTFEAVAPSTEGSHYALSLITKAKIRSGQRVLVIGATGAIGSAAVQLLKEIGARVTAICDAQHGDLVRDLGAERVIDRGVEDLTKDQQSYDIVLDAVGKSSFRRCKRLLEPRGIYVSTDLGPLSQNPRLALLTPLFGREKVMMPIPPKHTRQEVEGIKRRIESGTFRPIIDRIYPLEQIVDAYRYVETGQKIGNVVIIITPQP